MKKAILCLLVASLLLSSMAMAMAKLPPIIRIYTNKGNTPAVSTGDAVLWDASGDAVLWDASGDKVLWD